MPDVAAASPTANLRSALRPHKPMPRKMLKRNTPLQVCCEPARTKVRLSIHMNLIWVLIKMCFSWLLPVEELRISRTFVRGFSMNPMAVCAMPVRLQLARIHPPPARRRR